MAYNYSDQHIMDRMKNGPDAKRAASMAQWYAQYQAGDKSALQRMQEAAGMVPGHGAATPDAKNAARMYLSRMGGGPAQYMHEGDAEFNLGHTLGSVLKVAAPIAGMAIPGLGSLGAMAVGSLGSAAGGALHGDKFNLGKTLLAGGAGAAGQSLLHGGLSTMLHGGGQVGNAVQGGGGVASQAASGGGMLGKLGSFAGSHIGDIAKAGVGAAGFLENRAQNKSAADFNNEKLRLANQQLGQAQQDYDSREPFRKSIMARLGSMAQQPMGSSIYRNAA